MTVHRAAMEAELWQLMVELDQRGFDETRSVYADLLDDLGCEGEALLCRLPMVLHPSYSPQAYRRVLLPWLKLEHHETASCLDAPFLWLPARKANLTPTDRYMDSLRLDRPCHAMLVHLLGAIYPGSMNPQLAELLLREAAHAHR